MQKKEEEEKKDKVKNKKNRAEKACGNEQNETTSVGELADI